MSLRVRVAAASAAGALLTLAVAAVVLSVVLTRQQYATLDDDVRALAATMQPLLLADARANRPVQQRIGQRLAARADTVLGSSYVAVAHRDGAVVADLSSADAPADLSTTDAVGAGPTTVASSAGDYRVLVTQVGARGRRDVTVGLPVAPVRERNAAIRRAVLAVGALAVVAAMGIGLLLAGPAVRPLRLLGRRAALIGRGDTTVPLDDVRGAREVEELAGSLTLMQHDLARVRESERRSLAAARDFAATAAHELRTPLTALRTDLDVLRAHPDIAADDRSELLDSLTRAARRLETTLTALGQLARGDLVDAAQWTIVDLAELVASTVADETAHHRDLAVETVLPDGELPRRVWPGGVRLALANLLANAAVHGARHANVHLVDRPDGVLVVVDDDGPGVPPAERTAVLERFRRGSTARSSGSGLGLALVAQQAALHGGSVRLTDSPLGGLRVELVLRER